MPGDKGDERTASSAVAEGASLVCPEGVDTAASSGRSVSFAAPLPIEHLRRALDDLFAPSPLTYWFDFLASAGCFYGSFAVAASLPISNPLSWIAAVVSVVALYRAVAFIHELVHQPSGRMRTFRLAWNLLLGIPLLVPAFLYGSHLDHHRRHAYGTAKDGEYSPWGRPGNRVAIVMFLLSSLAVLPAAVVRFGLLTPLAWISRPVREWVWSAASSLVVDLRYRRDPPSPVDSRHRRNQEIGVFIYLLAVVGGLLTHLVDAALLAQLYLTAAAALFLNGLRTLAAHRYRSAGDQSTMTQQLVDSMNYPRRSCLTALWAPIGLRYHAVHHLFPGIPYHNLRLAHRRLVRLLPADSPYHQTEGDGLIASLRDLWRAAGRQPGRRLRGAPSGTAMRLADRRSESAD